jgi:hypothetical protein
MRAPHRSAAFWLRAYPRRWRHERAAEVVEVLTDLAPAGASRLDARTAAGLVRAGWATRWRQRPSLRSFLAYRLADRRPAPQYDGWLRDDLEGPLYPWRAALGLLLVIGPPCMALSLAVGWSTTWSAAGLGFAYVSTVVGHARGRAEKTVILFGAPAWAPPEIGPMGPYRRLAR